MLSGLVNGRSVLAFRRMLYCPADSLARHCSSVRRYSPVRCSMAMDSGPANSAALAGSVAASMDSGTRLTERRLTRGFLATHLQAARGTDECSDAATGFIAAGMVRSGHGTEACGYGKSCHEQPHSLAAMQLHSF